MPGSIARWLSSSAAGSCRIMERPRRASTITRRWSKSVSGARQGSRRCGLGGEGWSFVVFQSVQLAGISERLPSGSATSNSGVPRRFRVPISRNERPSKGCRSRSIVTEPERSRRWVVCDVFLLHIHRCRCSARSWCFLLDDRYNQPLSCLAERQTLSQHVRRTST